HPRRRPHHRVHPAGVPPRAEGLPRRARRGRQGQAARRRPGRGPTLKVGGQAHVGHSLRECRSTRGASGLPSCPPALKSPRPAGAGGGSTASGPPAAGGRPGLEKEENAVPPPRRVMRGREYFTLAFGSIVGVGWMILLDDWLRRGGPAGAMLGFLLGGIALVPVAC